MFFFTSKYTKNESGYMGQIIEWPEVITEGETLEECRFMLRDALQEMVLAHKQLVLDIPNIPSVFEQIELKN